jgi:hypothetical protein
MELGPDPTLERSKLETDPHLLDGGEKKKF